MFEFKPNDPSRMYASTRRRIYVSSNGGNSWSQNSINSPSNTTRIELAVTPANPNLVYAVFGGNWLTSNNPEYGFNGVYRSIDSGNTFSRQSNAPNILGGHERGEDDKDQSHYDLAITVSPTNTSEVHVGGINCWKSLNNGGTWSITSIWTDAPGSANYTHADIHELKFVGSTLYCGSDGGVYKSTNNANSWSSISTGLQITQAYRLGARAINGSSSPQVYYGAQDNGLNTIRPDISSAADHWHGADGFESDGTFKS